MTDIVCPKCQRSDGLVVTGLDVAAVLNRYATEEENRCKWSVSCFNCSATPAGSINDEARDSLFGTSWRGHHARPDAGSVASTLVLALLTALAVATVLGVAPWQVLA